MTVGSYDRSAGQTRSSFERVLAAVQGAGLRHKVTHNGNHIQAECPTHTDVDPSLSIDWMPGQAKTEYWCHGGCGRTEDILAALELTKPMMFDDYLPPEEFAERRAREREEERRTGQRARRQRPTAAKPVARPRPALPRGRLPGRLTLIEPRPVGEWSVVTTYDYCNLGAELVHQEVRHERPVEVVDPTTGATSTRTEKRFTQRWADRKNGWRDKTPAGFVPVLYRLPDVVEWIAEGRRIWLCEGAKDAERFLELGEAATTNPSGAGNFKAEQAAALSGAHVVVVLDHDLAGYRRGAKLVQMLAGAASLRLVLPVTAGRHEDASDHFDAGHTLADFVEVDVEQLVVLEQVAEAEEAALLAERAAQEAAARAQRAAEANTQARREPERRYAARWAAEAGKQLVRAAAALDAALAGHLGAGERQDRLVAAVTACQDAVAAAHRSAEVEISEELGAFLRDPAAVVATTMAALAAAAARRADVDDQEDEDDLDEEPGEEGFGDSNVVEHPTSARLPAPTAEIQMSRGVWAYELGGPGRRRRGVYQLQDGRWIKVAPLPYLHSRIVARDGYGRRTGTFYLVSAEQDSDRVIVGHDELARHTWLNMLDLACSQDDKILKAATTALTFAALEETELVEATPRLGADGKISAPVPETLPPGYLRCSELERAQAMTGWGQLLALVAQSPRMALVLGAAAIGPFLHGLNYQSHIVSLHGEMNQGKSVTMEAAAAIWGNPGDEAGGGVKMSWNMSGQGPTSFLGELGTLPAFFDEHGMAAPKNASEWGELIFRITQGASRGRPAPNGRIGFHSGRQWHGVLVSSGNSRLMDGIGAGDKSGTQRRVVELAAPFTLDQEHSERIEDLVPQIFGHIGREILERHSLDTVRIYTRRAGDLLGPFEHDSKTGQRMLEHMQAHVAGALLLDEICGTDGVLVEAALDGAWEYLADWSAPVHDADRIVEWLNDSLFREPSRWPTVAQHIESSNPPSTWDPDTNRSTLPVSGVGPNRLGLVANNGSWVGVYVTAWREMCEELDVDSDVACRELAAREILQIQNSARKPSGNGTYQSIVNIGPGQRKRLYKFDRSRLAYDEDDVPDPDYPEAGPGAAPPPPTEAAGESHSSGGTDAGAPTSCSNDSVDPEQLLLVPDATSDNVAEDEISGPVTGPDPEVAGGVTGGVTGQVTGATPSLNCEVTGVTGELGEIPRVRVQARRCTFPVDPQGAGQEPEIVRLDPDQPRPACVVCQTPAGQLVEGQPLHLGPCFDQVHRSAAPTATPESDPNSLGSRTESAMTVTTVAVETVGTSAEGHTVAEPASTEPTSNTASQRSPGPDRGSRPARFTAPAACLDAGGLHLADGSTKPWPQVRHLGDLALLTGREQLRLGWGGREDRLPDQGQVWLYADALERLGLPTTPAALPDKALTRSQRAKATAKIYAALDEHPMVAGALEEGWQLGQGGHLDVWTRIWHPELLPQGALIVGLPWHRIEGVALFEDNPTPSELARRLLLFAQQVGVAYRVTSAATGLDLIDHHRPPRRSINDDMGQNRRRVALVRRTAAELPPWRMKTSDARFTGLEQDFSWWRAWDKLPASEQGRRYVHGYDRNASYLVPWRSLELGVEGLVHRTGADAAWDGKEKPGYYLVDDDWEWPHWGLPDPGIAAGARVGHGRVWVTVHTLRQLAAHGVRPEVHESYSWDVTTRYLEGPGTVLAGARTSLSKTAASDAGAASVLATVKALYSATVGKLAEREHHADYHLWRPDWRDHVIGATKTAILHTLTKAQGLSGDSPLVVDRDAIFYASNDPDPVTAWPGDPTKLGVAIGSWKPIGTTDLATWGPRFLPKPTGRWHYADAVDQLTTAPSGAQSGIDLVDEVVTSDG